MIPILAFIKLSVVLRFLVTGIIEGLLLSWIFKTSKMKSILTLIVASYVSAWPMHLATAGLLAQTRDIPLQSMLYVYPAILLLDFFVIVLVELPFFWITLGTRERRLRLTVKATLVINAISFFFFLAYCYSVGALR